MKRYERIAGLFVLALGLASAVYSATNLKLGKLSMPDSGFLPFIASLIMTVSAGVWVLSNLGKDTEPQEAFWVKSELTRPVLALVLMIGYAATMEDLGYMLSTLAFMAIWQLVVEKAKPVRAGVIAVTSTLVMYFLFARLLGVPVPEGILAL